MCRHKLAYMTNEPLTLSPADTEDLTDAYRLADALATELAAQVARGRVDLFAMRLATRDLAGMVATVRKRQAKRQEARERRGSALQG